MDPKTMANTPHNTLAQNEMNFVTGMENFSRIEI
jgi:hypothetical protein